MKGSFETTYQSKINISQLIDDITNLWEVEELNPDEKDKFLSKYNFANTNIPREVSFIARHTENQHNSIIASLGTLFDEKYPNSNTYKLYTKPFNAAFAESIIVPYLEDRKLVTDLKYDSPNDFGSYNIVLHCKLSGQPCVLRLFKATTFCNKITDWYDYYFSTRNIMKELTGKNVIAEPIYSFDKYEFDQQLLKRKPELVGTVWQIMPILKPFSEYHSLEDQIKYIESMTKLINILHSNNYIYVDWKVDNYMKDESENIILSDIDFQNIDTMIEHKNPHIASTHNIITEIHQLCSLWSRYLQTPTTKNSLENVISRCFKIDNMGFIREVVVSLLFQNEYTSALKLLNRQLSIKINEKLEHNPNLPGKETIFKINNDLIGRKRSNMKPGSFLIDYFTDSIVTTYAIELCEELRKCL